MFLLDRAKEKHQKHLATLPKISQLVNDIEFFYDPIHFREIFLQKISNAIKRICIVSLFLEQDKAGKTILNALYSVKRQKPELDVYVLVDWHRAKRNRIGVSTSDTNVDWYYRTAKANPGINIPVFGVPINTNEVFGVLHFKGFIIDDTVLYSGASLNDVYLYQLDKYRYDRYHLIRNAKMADIMFDWINQNLIHSCSVYRLDSDLKNQETKKKIRHFRRKLLKDASYHFHGDANNEQLSVTPLIGLGKSSLLNKTIYHLIICAKKQLTICTPYFNLPEILVKNIRKLLNSGKNVEIIVGDKIANDFFIPENQPFKIIGILPYLYEINLRHFLSRFQRYINKNQLIIRLWKNKNNSFHLKGIWVDSEWILLTGNNLNPRAWCLDLENAILIHDPKHELSLYRERELIFIRTHTTIIRHYHDLQNISDYPKKIRKLIICLRRIRIDYFIKKIL